MHKAIVGYLVLALLAIGCGQQQEKRSIAYPVKIAPTLVQEVPYTVKGVGQLLASLQAEMKAQVSGMLTNVLFSDGQPVEENALLMTIDPRIYEARLQQAMAELAENEAKLRFSLDVAERYKTLAEKDYISRIDFQEATQDVDAHKAAVDQASARVKKAEVDLEFTQLRAPFRGYVGLRTYDPGNYIDAAVGKTLVTVNKITPITVRFYLPGHYLPEIRAKHEETTPLQLEAVLPDDPAHPLPGILKVVDNTINPDTGMITLQGYIPNEDERGWPGQFVRVNLQLKNLSDAVLVPKQAIVLGESGPIVFVLDEETMCVTMRMVGKGIVYQDYVVALWGLKGGEKVVVDGQLNLYDGAKVYIPN
jgi:membrane fusion protein, multidrug efflux system